VYHCDQYESQDETNMVILLQRSSITTEPRWDQYEHLGFSVQWL